METGEDKLSQGLQRLVAEDPTLRVEHNPETHEIVPWCMGGPPEGCQVPRSPSSSRGRSS